ncbi:MAG TPA: hypothetical protein VEY11_11565 [Pyrinomonadaceae bacterium]|nr:hypothetical protein [Pyrinomonadaceae bacterium]
MQTDASVEKAVREVLEELCPHGWQLLKISPVPAAGVMALEILINEKQLAITVEPNLLEMEYDYFKGWFKRELVSREPTLINLARKVNHTDG